MTPSDKSERLPLPLQAPVQIYQFHVLLLTISPAIWRRFLIRSDSTIADLHHILQILMGWSDEHLHQFTIHGKHYGVEHPGGIYFSTDPKKIYLCDFNFRLKERFLYEYDFNDYWQLQIRLEQILPLDPNKTYPFCITGARKTPPEDCGGPERFMEQEVKMELALWDKKFRLAEIMSALLPTIYDETTSIQAAVDPVRVELTAILQDLEEAKFNRFTINQRLKLYASGEVDWRWKELEKEKPKPFKKSIRTKKATK
ncbi:MAG: hypothetical protein BGO39_20550 [Chloroflexi bacterium 54-19]|nr:MAG: hypothetical protein BGO39_20550 [Chloroflexi bacterium 54-19]